MGRLGCDNSGLTAINHFVTMLQWCRDQGLLHTAYAGFHLYRSLLHHFEDC